MTKKIAKMTADERVERNKAIKATLQKKQEQVNALKPLIKSAKKQREKRVLIARRDSIARQIQNLNNESMILHRSF